MPRLGHPIQFSQLTNSKSRDSPRMTSGTTSGASNANPKMVRPRNRENLDILKPAKVPRLKAIVAANVATSKLVSAAARNPSFLASSPYQRVEKPAQTVTSRDALNEERTSSPTGAYKNANPSSSTAIRNPPPVLVELTRCGPAREISEQRGSG